MIKKIFEDLVGITKLRQSILSVDIDNRSLKNDIKMLSKDLTKEKLQDALSICLQQYEFANHGMIVSHIEILETLEGKSIANFSVMEKSSRMQLTNDRFFLKGNF